MNQIIDGILEDIETAGNMRSIPRNCDGNLIDLSSNDYLGLSVRDDLRDEFFGSINRDELCMSASASRLLAGRQSAFSSFEDTLAESYGAKRKALLFNSGYHANTGMVSAFAGISNAYILADRLVHASIIDGIKLSGLPFARFRHNDLAHLDILASKAYAGGKKLIIIAESVYSMDGDYADIDGLAAIKKRYPGSLLYIDEAHAVGVEGPGGLGLCKASKNFEKVDILMGTLGKALASTGAYAITSDMMRSFMVNKARSLIFSTALPPLCVRWSEFIFRRSLDMDSERAHLKELGRHLATVLAKVGGNGEAGHIQALICGDPRRAVELSHELADEGFAVLPIRTPTVPAGTDRLRFSLSAALSEADIDRLDKSLKKILLK